MPRLARVITEAVKCGPMPASPSLKRIIKSPRTAGENVIAFAARHLIVPEGMKTGQPLLLEPFQIAFILSVMDNPAGTRHAYLSVARRNGKTLLVGVILLSYIIGPMAGQNTSVASAALSRDQAALCFNLMQKMLMMSPDVQRLYRTIPSQKKIIGLSKNVEYTALASDAKTGFGQSLRVVLLDEAGQIVGPNNAYIDMLTTSQGSYEDSLMLTISTQSPSDADFLSVMMDAAARSGDKHTVCHIYESDADCDLMDEKQWRKSNPGLGIFRSVKDLREQLHTANMIPAKEAGSRNLLLNQRVAQESLFLSPAIWKKNDGVINLDIFRNNRVVAGLDLSARNDLTACVLSAMDDDGKVHCLPFVFCPRHGIEERSKRDRAPYDVWVKQEYLIPLGGEVMNYDQIAEYLRDTLDDLEISIDDIEFDRWHIKDFQAACERAGAFGMSEWHEVGQGFKDMGPRCDCLLNNMLAGNIRHGAHPLLTMAAANAIAVSDPTGAVKLDKRKSTLRIDPLVSMVMAVYPLLDGDVDQPVNVLSMIG